MILRHTPIRRKRRTLRRGELTPAEKQAVRREVYERAGGCCELGFEGCIKGVLPWDITRGGSNDDTNLATACFACNRSKRCKLLVEWRPSLV